MQLFLKSLAFNQFFDEEGKIIYVGKAKRLKRRVASYFNKVHDIAKTNVMVKKIADIKHLVVETEEDALLLENNLIKKYQPRYNILLKDDKTYPWICIKKETYPRVSITRQLNKRWIRIFWSLHQCSNGENTNGFNSIAL